MPVGKTSVAKTFAKRPLQQRIIALAAAYAIALASLIASFGAAQAAAEAAMQPDAFICHSSAAERPAPTSDDSNGKICVGCAASAALAAVPAAVPPAASAAIIRQISARGSTRSRIRPDRQRRIKRASLARPSTGAVKAGGRTRPLYCFTR